MKQTPNIFIKKIKLVTIIKKVFEASPDQLANTFDEDELSAITAFITHAYRRRKTEMESKS